MHLYNPSTWEAEAFNKMNVFRSREPGLHKRSYFKRKRGGERGEEGRRKGRKEGGNCKQLCCSKYDFTFHVNLAKLRKTEPRALERDKQNFFPLFPPTSLANPSYPITSLS